MAVDSPQKIAVAMTTVPRLPQELIRGYQALDDLTGAVSDAMDNTGLTGAIPASTLHPVSLGRIVGQAMTVRNVESNGQVSVRVSEGISKMGEARAYALAEPGDVIVIEGLFGVSNMGGQSATMAFRRGCAGAVIEGSIRDPEASRQLGFPIWCRGITPITGKWRLETVAINGPVRIAGIQVNAGDLVVADEAGVCIVPQRHAQAVLVQAQKVDVGDAKRKQDINRGVDIETIVKTKYK